MGIGRRRNYDWEEQTRWNEEARLYGRIVHFSPATPPLDWENQHTKALVVTALGHAVDAPTALFNRPTPRLANHHYFSVDNDSRNVYFY